MKYKSGRPRTGLKRKRIFTLRVDDDELDWIHRNGGSQFIRGMIFRYLVKPTEQNAPESSKEIK